MSRVAWRPYVEGPAVRVSEANGPPGDRRVRPPGGASAPSTGPDAPEPPPTRLRPTRARIVTSAVDGGGGADVATVEGEIASLGERLRTLDVRAASASPAVRAAAAKALAPLRADHASLVARLELLRAQEDPERVAEALADMHARCTRDDRSTTRVEAWLGTRAP